MVNLLFSVYKGNIMKAKTLTVCLAIFVLVSQSAYALPKASGAGAQLKVENSRVENNVQVKDSEGAATCGQGVGVCNLSGKSNLSGAGANIEVKNSRIKNEVKVSGSKNAITCGTGVGVCNMDTKK